MQVPDDMATIDYSTVRLDDTEIRVTRGGAGAPLLFLPDAAIGAAWQAFHDRLARRLRVILPEHPGYGGGDAPAWLDGVADLANFYLDFLERQELNQVHLVGASLGGWIAAELATRNTARLASLTLIDPWGIRVAGVTGIDPFVTNDEDSLRDLFFDPDIAQVAIGRVLAPDGEDALLKGKMVTAKLAWQPRLFDPNLAKWLHRVDVPTLILWGDQDRLLPPAYAAAWNRAIPRSKLHNIFNAGHLPHVERPDDTAAAILEFTRIGT
jgi:pimeloyl-ACP methyl ester carboxylesterase